MIDSGTIATVVGAYLWPLFRIAGVFSVAPVLGSQLVPMRIRLGLALAVTLLVAPLVPAAPVTEPVSLNAALLAIQQVLIGVAIGFALRLVFGALELGAQIIALQMGLGFAELIDPQNGTNVPTLSQFYVMIGTLVFLALNGHHLLIQLLVHSFETLPIGAGAVPNDALWSLAEWGGAMFRGALMVALPATAALISVNVTMGVMTRAVPQFNMFVAFPALLLLGFLIVMVSLPSLVPQLTALLDAIAILLTTELVGAP